MQYYKMFEKIQEEIKYKYSGGKNEKKHRETCAKNRKKRKSKKK